MELTCTRDVMIEPTIGGSEYDFLARSSFSEEVTSPTSGLSVGAVDRYCPVPCTDADVPQPGLLM